jgi:3-oxoacyl-[acyl-carrier protein] reductase
VKRILVTGGSRGLGLAICRKLLAEGCQVLTTSRRESSGLLNLHQQFGPQLVHLTCDFAKEGEVLRLASEARLIDGVDGFVANAGIGTEGLLTLAPESAIRECVEVNLVANLLLAREVLKGMLDRGGSLVFISSVAARTGLSGLTVYSATKGALVSFSRAIAREYGERGIRSNCILPGFLETDMSESLSSEVRARLARRTALKRLGQPEDVVGCVSFLLSDAARYITGTEIVVDGGMLA